MKRSLLGGVGLMVSGGWGTGKAEPWEDEPAGSQFQSYLVAC